MYTEISHFLLLQAISQEILRFICLVSFWSLWCALPKPVSKKSSGIPTSRKRHDRIFQVHPFLVLKLTNYPKWKENRIIRNLRASHKWISNSLAKNVANSAWVSQRALAFFFCAPMDRHFQPNIPGESRFAWTKPFARRKSDFNRRAVFSTFFLILTSCFFGTVSNYVSSDFSIYNILTNSTADIPLFYKIAATWSNHEGSLLLWCWLLSFNTFLFCISIYASPIIVRFFSSNNAFFFAFRDKSSVISSNRQMYMAATRIASRLNKKGL